MTDTPETPSSETSPSEAPRSRFFNEGRAGVAALAVSVVALIAAVAPYATGGDFDGRVRNYLLQHPELLQEMSTSLQTKEDDARAEAISRRAAASPSLLAVDSRDPTFGPADAKVTVIEYFDFRCPGCKATAPEVVRLMQAHPDVRFVFKDWPILDRGAPDGPSHYAARAAQAAHRQGKYLPVFRALMAAPSLTNESIDRILADNGVSMPQAQAVIRGNDVTAHLAETHTSASALGLQGTPTFFVNGRATPTIQPTEIDRAIREAKAGRGGAQSPAASTAPPAPQSAPSSAAG